MALGLQEMAVTLHRRKRVLEIAKRVSTGTLMVLNTTIGQPNFDKALHF